MLVQRLKGMLNPMRSLGLSQDTAWLETTEPLARYREKRRGVVYHRRRIRYFVDQLRAGLELDPIELDNLCDHSHIYPEPVLIDGHHRLLACILADEKTVPAFYGGRVDLLRYLEGKRATCPME